MTTKRLYLLRMLVGVFLACFVASCSSGGGGSGGGGGGDSGGSPSPSQSVTPQVILANSLYGKAYKNEADVLEDYNPGRQHPDICRAPAQ